MKKRGTPDMEDKARRGPPSDPGDPKGIVPSDRPIEPQGTGFKGKTLFRWVLFAAFILWAVLTAYHEPILNRVGGFLVVSQDLKKSDLIVCLAGGAVERGLAAADLFGQGLAPRVFVAREIPPDGYDALERIGVHIAETADIARSILTGSGVPQDAVIVSERPAKSTLTEAAMVRALMKKGGLRSLIVVTSPTHTRRAWWTFRHVMEGDGVRILVSSSPYSGFRPTDWWKTRRYVKEVIIEYQKLLFYAVTYFFG